MADLVACTACAKVVAMHLYRLNKPIQLQGKLVCWVCRALVKYRVPVIAPEGAEVELLDHRPNLVSPEELAAFRLGGLNALHQLRGYNE